MCNRIEEALGVWYEEGNMKLIWSRPDEGIIGQPLGVWYGNKATTTKDPVSAPITFAKVFEGFQMKSSVAQGKRQESQVHPLINNYIIEYNIFNNNNFILGTFRFLATMRFHRQELPPHLGEFVHALNKALATTQTQLSRPMSSGYHIYMENRLWRKPLLMLTIQVWMATLCDTTYGGNSNWYWS